MLAVADIYEVYLNARVVVTTPPAIEPITVEEVMAERRNDDATDIAGIERRITAARMKVEADTGRALITQSLDIYMDAFPSGYEVLVPRPMLQSIESITTYGIDNSATVWDDGEYLVDIAADPGRVALSYYSDWPSDLRRHRAIKLSVVAGYGDTEDDVPALLKQAMHLLIGQFDEHRENVIVAQFAGQFLELPHGYESLIAPFRLEFA